MRVSTSKKREVIDITNDVAGQLPGGSGVAHVFVKHTTAAVTTADLDPGTDLDMIDFLDSLVPDKQWRHPLWPNARAGSLAVFDDRPECQRAFQDGKLNLGTWQRIILIEFDGPRDRDIAAACVRTEQ